MELARVGASATGEKAKEMLDLSGPGLDFVALATGMGLPASRATTSEEFVDALRTALATDGPSVIEAIVPSIL
jgi:acetolactate synthase-1/2/3 large subunit